jgi:hypothetical protein
MNIKIMTRKVVSKCKQKRCKIQTTKIKIMTTRIVGSGYNKEGREGR